MIISGLYKANQTKNECFFVRNLIESVCDIVVSGNEQTLNEIRFINKL